MSIKSRRDVVKRLDVMRSVASALRAEFEELATELQEVFDERSEAWQMSDKGDAWQEMIEGLNDQAEKLDEVSDFTVDD